MRRAAAGASPGPASHPQALTGRRGKRRVGPVELPRARDQPGYAPTPDERHDRLPGHRGGELPQGAPQPAARRGERADVLLCDAARLPLRDGSFDVAWCNDSFHHYPDPERAAFQAWLVLAPGGALVVGDAWQPEPARAIMNAWMPRSRGGDVRIYSEAEMRRILGTWFSDVSWRRVGQTACVAVARKGA